MRVVCIGAKACGMHTAFIDHRKRLFGETLGTIDKVCAPGL